ncbi:MAG: hypothetical protein JXR69_06840 [Candidatus Delongbacteria bacterium]|nr:hypothetical protein [Candidatus Delongbacteria bacterium]
MRDSINWYGSVALWFKNDHNTGIFQSGRNYIWKKFDLTGKECSIISEGNKVSVVLDLGSNKERTIISTVVKNSKIQSLHSLVLKWTNNLVSIYINNEYLKDGKF